jgi:hypothetical protein
VPGATSCYDLPLELCEQDPSCMIEYYGTDVPCECDPNTGECADCAGGDFGVCVPRPAPVCYSDDDCGANQRCAIEVYCPDCYENDPACYAPCWEEGHCVDIGPSICSDGSVCPDGFQCEPVVVCEGGCGGGVPGDDNGAPPPDQTCEEYCWEEAICVPVDQYCYSDEQCAPGQSCAVDLCLPDPSCPECDVCVGICIDDPIQSCWVDADCGAGFICNTWDYCDDAGMPNGLVACLGRCEEVPAPPTACLENADCATGERCATELDICYCPDDVCTMEQPCYSLCVAVPDGTGCYDDSACGNGQTCVFDEANCAQDPDGFVACYGMCWSEIVDPEPSECFDDVDCGPNAICELTQNPDGTVTGKCVEGECVQVEQAAVDPNTGDCIVFPTPCDVPADWELVPSCEAVPQ